MGTLPETNSSHLKMDGWNTFSFPYGAKGLFSGALAVSFRECTFWQLNFFQESSETQTCSKGGSGWNKN